MFIWSSGPRSLEWVWDQRLYLSSGPSAPWSTEHNQWGFAVSYTGTPRQTAHKLVIKLMLPLKELLFWHQKQHTPIFVCDSLLIPTLRANSACFTETAGYYTIRAKDCLLQVQESSVRSLEFVWENKQIIKWVFEILINGLRRPKHIYVC